MYFDGRRTLEISSPWRRGRPKPRAGIRFTMHSFREEFDHFIYANKDLSIDAKRTAMKASASVVSVVALKGGKANFMCSGTIIDCEEGDSAYYEEEVEVEVEVEEEEKRKKKKKNRSNGTYVSTLLTSASLLKSCTELDGTDDTEINVYLWDGSLFEGKIFACDFHYNIAAIKIESDVQLPTATLRLLDDSISVDPNETFYPGVNGSFQLHPHSDLYKLCPGDMVVAIGRYFKKPYKLMVAPGTFSLDCCDLDCTELFRADCKISKCGIGGPLINCYGEVIGLNFYNTFYTPFLPINIVCKCLEHFKRYGRFSRPWLGMKMTNLYAASVAKLERIIRNFPNIFKGVIVEEVKPGSPAGRAGIRCGDVIVECNGNSVKTFLEFLCIIWDKTGETVELIVIRERSSARLKLTVMVNEISQNEFNSWPVCEEEEVFVSTGVN